MCTCACTVQGSDPVPAYAVSEFLSSSYSGYFVEDTVSTGLQEKPFTGGRVTSSTKDALATRLSARKDAGAPSFPREDNVSIIIL